MAEGVCGVWAESSELQAVCGGDYNLRTGETIEDDKKSRKWSGEVRNGFRTVEDS